MRVTPTLVQAAEAALRCTLEPSVEPCTSELQRLSAYEASSCRMSAECATPCLCKIHLL